jgi:NitT/TauT family transport system permease protein
MRPLIRQPIRRSTATLLGILALLVLLGAYTALSARQHRINPTDTTIPTWGQLADGVAQALRADKRTAERWLVEDLKASGLRLALGLGLGVAGALLVGMSMGCFSQVEACLYPVFSLLAKIPPTAAMAVFFVLVGTELNMYVTMIAFGVLPTLAMTVYLAVREFPMELQYKAYTLGASHGEVIYPMIFSYVLPKLIDAVRLMIGPAIVYLIAAEMLVGDVGFGYRLRLQGKLLNMSVVYFYLGFLAAFGFGVDYALRGLQRWWCPWFEKYRG